MNLNYIIYRLKYRFARSLPLEVPVDVSMELSSFCTNRCGYCYHAEPKKLPFVRKHMSYELAKKIIAECAHYGVHSLKTNYRGESSLNPHFRDITKYAKDLSHGGTLIDRITNSNFNFKISRNDIFEGMSYQTKVKISFDSFNKEVFEKQRTGSNFEKTRANIDKFYLMKGRDNIMSIQAVRTNLNKDEDLRYETNKRWPGAEVSIRDCVEGRVDTDLTETVVRHRDLSDRQPCIQAFARLMIRADGSTGACCPDIKGEISLGNANYCTIIEMFNSHNAKVLRETLKSKQAFAFDPCKTCSSFESYKNFKPVWDS